MKNIHVLPTDKPSRLFKDDKGVLNLHTHSVLKGIFTNGIGSNQHIYITSDEEIKEERLRWIVDNRNGMNGFIHQVSVILGSNVCPEIILTTDQDLIKDGVQAIDDEFLEWFVKNPGCEEVEVKRNKKLSKKSIWDAKEGDLVFNNHNCGGVIKQLSDDIRVHIVSENGEGYMETAITSDNGIDTLVINNYKVYEYSDYKIIIPKEELKSFSDFSDKFFGSVPKEEPKQETLEEAAVNCWAEGAWDNRDNFTDGFIEGAKSDAARDYWFEQFKNK